MLNSSPRCSDVQVYLRCVRCDITGWCGDEVPLFLPFLLYLRWRRLERDRRGRQGEGVARSHDARYTLDQVSYLGASLKSHPLIHRLCYFSLCSAVSSWKDARVLLSVDVRVSAPAGSFGSEPHIFSVAVRALPVLTWPHTRSQTPRSLRNGFAASRCGCCDMACMYARLTLPYPAILR